MGGCAGAGTASAGSRFSGVGGQLSAGAPTAPPLSLCLMACTDSRQVGWGQSGAPCPAWHPLLSARQPLGPPSQCAQHEHAQSLAASSPSACQ